MKKIIAKKLAFGKRIDKFLAKEFFSYSRGEIAKFIKDGKVLVSGKKVKSSYRLKTDDIIQINFRSLKIKNKLIPNPRVGFKVIYKDENIIVVDKPAGLCVHPTKSNETNTLANGLLSKFPEIKNIHDASPGAEFRPGIVHRLDKDTSGVMVVARNMKTFEELKKIFKERKIEKKYVALVYGKLKEKSGVIEKPIARAGTYKKQVIAGRKTKTKIREAVTEYKALKEFNNYSLLEVMPKTGRTHQIRVHLFSIGHPIVGDKLYKLKNIKRADAPRQMLHAKFINFKIFGVGYTFNADLPRDMINFTGSID